MAIATNNLQSMIRDLQRRKARGRRGLALVEGVRLVEEALNTGLTLKGVLVAPDLARTTRGRELRALLETREVPVQEVSDRVFNTLADTETPQGIVAVVEPRRWKVDEIPLGPAAVVLVIDGVQDPGNVGTIVRLAAAFDANGVVRLPGCADPFGPKAIRSSAGAILTVPVVNCSIDELLAHGWDVIAADTRGEIADPPSHRAILAFGSEGSGLSPALADVARTIAIRMSPRIESLNVASSAAILLARSYALR